MLKSNSENETLFKKFDEQQHIAEAEQTPVTNDMYVNSVVQIQPESSNLCSIQSRAKVDSRLSFNTVSAEPHFLKPAINIMIPNDRLYSSNFSTSLSGLSMRTFSNVPHCHKDTFAVRKSQAPSVSLSVLNCLYNHLMHRSTRIFPRACGPDLNFDPTSQKHTLQMICSLH